MNSMNKQKRKNYFAKCAHGSKKSRYAQYGHTLEAGVHGFLLTCNKKEKEATRDAYALLNEYADRLHGPEEVYIIC